MENLDAAAAEGRRRAEENLARFEPAVSADMARWKLTRDHEQFLRQISRGRFHGRALLSNRDVRLTAQFALIDAALEAYRRDPHTRRYFVTVAIDDWVTWEREPHLDPGMMINKVQSHIRRAGLEGVGAVEFDVWKNLTGEPGRRIVKHVHFLGRATERGEFKPRAVEAEMQSRRSLVNTVGGPSVTIKSIVQLEADIARVAQYILKAPDTARNCVFKPDGKWDLYDCAFPPGAAARLFEIMSHIELPDMVFAIGAEGRDIAQAVRTAVRDQAFGARIEAPNAKKVARQWAAIRAQNGSKLLQPCVIVAR